MGAEWFYQVQGRQFGPMSPAELRRFADTGILPPDTLVCRATTAGVADGRWVRAAQVRGLFGTGDSPLATIASQKRPQSSSMPPPLPQTAKSIPPVAQVAHLEPTASEPSVKPIRPWIRLWARLLDTWCVTLVVGFFLGGLLGSICPAIVEWHERFGYFIDVGFGMVLLFVYCLVESIFFSVFGTTPGKALLGVEVRTESGNLLSFDEAMKRSLMVWFYGWGVVPIGIVQLVTFVTAYDNLKRSKITTWDRLGHFDVSYRQIGVLKGIFAIAIIVGLFMLSANLREGSQQRRKIPESVCMPRPVRDETAVREKPFAETWPAAFSTEISAQLSESRTTEDQFLPFHLKGSETEAKWFGAAYAFHVSMNRYVAFLGSKFPYLKARLIAGKTGFDTYFGPAVENILWVVQSRGPEWKKAWMALNKELEKQTSAEDISAEKVEAVVCEVENAGKGAVKSPVLETLLMYHPKYQRDPSAEFADGFKRSYVSDGTGNARGIRLKIAYPASWKAEARSSGAAEEALLKKHPEMARVNTIHTFKSYSGQGPEEVMLQVGDSPIPGIHDPPSDEEANEITRAVSEMSGSEIDIGDPTIEADAGITGMRKVASGRVRISGKPAIWVETEARMKPVCEAQGKRTEVEITFHQLRVMVCHRGRLVLIQCQVRSIPKCETVSSVDRFVRMAPVFQQMLTSLAFDPIHEAVRARDAQAVRAAVQNAAACLSETEEDSSGFGFTPLHTACERGFKDMAELLLALGANVNVRARNGETPLITAIAEHGKENMDLALFFIAKGADVKASRQDGETALHFAAIENMSNLAQTLIEKGAVVDARTVKGETPLHFAYEFGSKDVIQVLIKNGADVNAQRADGKTPSQVPPHDGPSR
jgi:uncharacterized RDD family membrane protein YckC